jgi:endonuclease YncB( thermonuclease family)
VAAGAGDQSVNAGATRRGFGLGLASLGLALAGCSPAPDLVGGERGRISRVSDGDALALDTGQKVRLVEIEAPQPGFDDRADQPYAVEARAMLNAVALGRGARLWYGGLSRDRYDRALAHVIASDETGNDIWLNGLMARQGGARVRTFPDNARRARALLKLEAEARAAKKGLWASDFWRVRAYDDLESAPAFVLVEGALLAIEPGGEALMRIAAGGFRLAAPEMLGKPDAELDLSVGRKLRVRGRIERNAPEMKLTHWAQMEMA